MRPSDEMQDNNDRVDNMKFERVVSGLFSPENFAIERKPVSAAMHASYSDPGLIVKFKKTGQRFAVVSLFRQDFSQGQVVSSDVILWASQHQIDHYIDYANSKKIPVFVAIGVKGYPDDPEQMYCIPLDDIKKPEILPSIYGRYRRPPDKPFFWQMGKLK
jgi:hypothetical protein